MANKSSIKKTNSEIYYYTGDISEVNGNVAIYKCILKFILKIYEKKCFYVKLLFILAKDGEKTIKLMYPIEGYRQIAFFDNEIDILKKLNNLFPDPVEKGIVRLFASGNARWKHENDATALLGYCKAIVYTYGSPLFPKLKQCVQNNDRMMLFWYFSRMVSPKANVLKMFELIF